MCLYFLIDSFLLEIGDSHDHLPPVRLVLVLLLLLECGHLYVARHHPGLVDHEEAQAGQADDCQQAHQGQHSHGEGKPTESRGRLGCLVVTVNYSGGGVGVCVSDRGGVSCSTN